MRSNYIIALLMLIFAGTLSCTQDDYCSTPDFNIDETQKQTDIQAIDQYLSAENIVADIHSSGIRYKIVNTGTGATADVCKRIRVSYVGKTLNGEVFDGTGKDVDGNDLTVDFNLSGLIPGWQIGIPLIKAGGEINLYIPSGYAYGSNSFTANGVLISSNSPLIFEIKLVAVY